MKLYLAEDNASEINNEDNDSEINKWKINRNLEFQ